MTDNILGLLKIDPWLEPSAQDINDRFNRYESKLKAIETDFKSIEDFADGYKYLGINYDAKRKGWTYREWAPQAHALFLTGDFNEWSEFSHPMKKDEYGIWEIFLDQKTYKNSFCAQVGNKGIG